MFLKQQWRWIFDLCTETICANFVIVFTLVFSRLTVVVIVSIILITVLFNQYSFPVRH